MSLTLCVCVCLYNTIYSELLQTPSVPWADSHMGLCAWVCFLYEQLRNSSSTNNAHRSRTIVPLTVFVLVVGRQEMRSCWGLWLCAWKAYRRAGPGQDENTNHLLVSLAGLMEMSNSWFSAMYQCKVESGYARHHQLTRALNLSPSFHYLDSEPAFVGKTTVNILLTPKRWLKLFHRTY